MSNGFLAASLLAMWRAAVLVPAASGAKVTVKVVVPAGDRWWPSRRC